MNITVNKSEDGRATTVTIDGSIDTITAPKLEDELSKLYEGTEKLYLDFASVDYISSAGLRTIMTAFQAMGESDNLVLRNLNDDVREVFEMTGFDELLTIEV